MHGHLRIIWQRLNPAIYYNGSLVSIAEISAIWLLFNILPRINLTIFSHINDKVSDGLKQNLFNKAKIMQAL